MDLLRLTETGLLEQRKRGRAFVYFAPPDLDQRIRDASVDRGRAS
jgi:predicted transcriptional regulator